MIPSSNLFLILTDSPLTKKQNTHIMNNKNEKFKLRLGLFVVGGLVLFVLAIVIIGKQKHLFDPVFKVSTTFYNVGGLQVGNNVRFSGINVGTVDRISIINDSTVRVDMLIIQRVQQFIKADAQVGIGSEGIIGDRLLVISQGNGSAETIKAGQELISSEPVETDAIIASLEVTALNIELITGEIANMVADINRGKGTLGRLINDPTIATNLSQTMENLKSSSQGLDENMEAVQDNIFLRGYFKRKNRDERKKKEAEKKAAEALENEEK